MMSYGYKPELSEGAVKCPIFQTSTFAFESAEDGKAFFEVAYGLREKSKGEEIGLIYSRLNNPDLEILENRLSLWDEADDAAVFESGMAAIATNFMEFLNPGDLLLHSGPLYGGTDHFIKHFLIRYNINTLEFRPNQTKREIVKMVEESGFADRLKMIYIETPANPTNALIDIEMCRSIADKFSTKENRVILTVDNTYVGPLWQHPMKHGADLVIYSATKFIGGHSDVIAGAIVGRAELLQRIKGLRTFMGNMAGPWTGWLLMRSLETLKLRMTQQNKSAMKIAKFLNKHPKVEKVYYPGLLKKSDGKQYKIFKKQYDAPGSMISFDIKGKEKQAFKFINNLAIFKLAVSLGSTESLVQHPDTMTHAGVDPHEKKMLSISEKLIRLSIGVEDTDDLIDAIDSALKKV